MNMDIFVIMNENNLNDKAQIIDKFQIYHFSPYFLNNFGVWMLIEILLIVFGIIFNFLLKKFKNL